MYGAVQVFRNALCRADRSLTVCHRRPLSGTPAFRTTTGDSKHVAAFVNYRRSLEVLRRVVYISLVYCGGSYPTSTSLICRAFSQNGRATIIPLRSTNVRIGQRRAMSATDILEINRLYGCEPRSRPQPRPRPQPGTPAPRPRPRPRPRPQPRPQRPRPGCQYVPLHN